MAVDWLRGAYQGIDGAMDSFYTRHPSDADGGFAVASTPLTRGPWDDRFQHGGPPSALLAGAIARFEGAEGFALARISLTFQRAVPIDVLRVEVAMQHAGRATQRLEARLWHGDRCVLSAVGLRIRRAEVLARAPEEPVWPAPESVDRFVFPFFQNDVGYHQAVDLRCAGGAFGATPVQFWARPLVPLVAGRASLPEERAVILSDAQSGMGVPLSPFEFTFANPDLTVAFARPPAGEWIGLDIRSIAGPAGAGLAQSLLRDASGVFGGASQSLLTAPR